MRQLALALLCAPLVGCYAEYVAPTYGGGYVAAEIPVGPPAPISVSMAPPPLRYEPVLSCGYNQTFIRGGWHWRDSWYWSPGRCVGVVSGYSYVPPSYSGGVYIAGHWAGGGGYYRPGPAYVPPPAPVYRPAYVPPPAPAYRPAPAPVPVYRPAPVPVYGAPPPAPAYRPAPVPVYRPAPVPVYRPAPVPAYGVPPPAPAYRPAPAPVYSPPPRPISAPPPAPAYR